METREYTHRCRLKAHKGQLCRIIRGGHAPGFGKVGLAILLDEKTGKECVFMGNRGILRWLPDPIVKEFDL